jgi:hypothetical protein
MLELISRVIARWSDTTNLILIAGDFNASCRLQVGYVESETIRSADARLGEWCRQEGLSCAAPSHATWQNVNNSRSAVLDSFFLLSKTKKMAIQGVKSFLPPDPQLDHDLLQARLSCDTLGSMPPLEALRPWCANGCSVGDRKKQSSWRQRPCH